MNIVLLIVDTLRYDHIAFHGKRKVHTPNFDRLAERSMVFDNSFNSSFPTIPHRTDVMRGKPGGPFHAWQPLRHNALTLPRYLAEEAGYATQLIHDTPHLVNGGHNFDWPFHAWTPVRGAEVDRPWIDRLDYLPRNWRFDPLFDCTGDSFDLNSNTGTYVRANRKRVKPEDWNAAKLFLTASEFLKDNTDRENFFLWLDCFDPHEPWDVPEEFMLMYDDTPGYDGSIDPRSFSGRYCEELSREGKKRVTASYSAKVSLADRWFGVFLDTLEATGLSKNTALILTADHGTSLYEFGRIGKGSPCHEPEAHTPFMVYLPDGPAGRSDAVIQPQDIFATACHIADTAPPEGLDSHNAVTAFTAGGPGNREIASVGGSYGWHRNADQTVFSVFDGTWNLEVAADPEYDRLFRMESEENVISSNTEKAKDLHLQAISELKRRGADSMIVKRFESSGESDVPQGTPLHDFWPEPEGYDRYFKRLFYEA